MIQVSCSGRGLRRRHDYQEIPLLAALEVRRGTVEETDPDGNRTGS